MPKRSLKSIRPTSVPVDRKENIITDQVSPQASCSYIKTLVAQPTIDLQNDKAVTRPNKCMVKSRLKKDVVARMKSGIPGGRQAKATTQAAAKQKLRVDLASKFQSARENPLRHDNNDQKDRVQLREIRFIKGGEGKKIIAKYKDSVSKSEENLVVSWDAACTSGQVFSQKQGQGIPNLIAPRRRKKGTGYRVHSFARSQAKAKRIKRNLRRLETEDGASKLDKVGKSAKKKRFAKKSA